MRNYVKENYLYMLDQLGISIYEFKKKGLFSPTTERRIRNGNIETISDSIVSIIVDYYNEHGTELHPHHIDINDFKYTDLSKSTLPKWDTQDVAGDYIALFLSKRGTGKPKSMALQIKEAQDHTLEVRAIDIIQNPAKTTDIIASILNTKDLDKAKEIHRDALNKDSYYYSLLRGSRFLHGEASGRGNLMTISLKDGSGYEMTISTLLKSYLNTRNQLENKYSWRGGAAIASVCEMDRWPYSMIIGMIRIDHWHPDPMSTEALGNALIKMNSYQRKENILSLSNDIDALFYEVFMEIDRQSKEPVLEQEHY